MKGECPVIEMLAAYVDQCLTAAERRLVEAHLVECRLCRQTVVMTLRTKATIEDPVIPFHTPDQDDS